MVTNYIKWAIRSLRTSSTYSLVNIIGLAVGLASSFFILIYIINQTSYDKHQINKECAFRVLAQDHTLKMKQPNMPFITATTLKNEIPEIKKAASIRKIRSFKTYKGQEKIDERGVYSVEPDIFDILTFEFIYGNKQGCLDNINNIAISDVIAKKYFNTDDAVGKELVADVYEGKVVFKVKAVFKEYPRLSTIKPQMLVHSHYALSELNRYNKEIDFSNTFLVGQHTCYILLNDVKSKGVIELKINDVMRKHLDKEREITYSIQAIKDFYFHSNEIVNNGLQKGNLSSVWLFTLIAILILSIAVINYIILSIARSVTRSKEIGLKRIVGANQKRIILQLLGESSIVVLIAAIIGIPLVRLSLDTVQKFFDTNLEFSLSSSFQYYIAFAAIALVLALVSGLLISRHYSRINPINAIKNTLTAGAGKSYFRNALIIVQITIFIALLSSMIVIKKQINYAITKDPGFNKENLLYLYLGDASDKYSSIKQELSKHPSVKMISGASFLPPSNDGQVSQVPSPADPNVYITYNSLWVDFNFLETMGMNVIEGRSFDSKLSTDSTKAVIINQTAVKKFELSNPIGKKIAEELSIIGIVKDFNMHSFHYEVPPTFINIVPLKYAREIVIRYNKAELPNLISDINRVWKDFSPKSKPEYPYYEEIAKDLYTEENQLANILLLFSSCAIFIAMLGLFGLTVFVTERRIKEIGIRKVQGASELQIIRIFTKGFATMVLIALAIAVPITIYLMHKWLNRFVYKEPISWWIFALSAAIAFVFVMLVTSIKTYRIARVNPVETLRYE
jgi:putative ABC transport system permease protein